MYLLFEYNKHSTWTMAARTHAYFSFTNRNITHTLTRSYAYEYVSHTFEQTSNDSVMTFTSSADLALPKSPIVHTQLQTEVVLYVALNINQARIQFIHIHGVQFVHTSWTITLYGNRSSGIVSVLYTAPVRSTVFECAGTQCTYIHKANHALTHLYDGALSWVQAETVKDKFFSSAPVVFAAKMASLIGWKFDWCFVCVQLDNNQLWIPISPHPLKKCSVVFDRSGFERETTNNHGRTATERLKQTLLVHCIFFSFVCTQSTRKPISNRRAWQ